MPSAFRTCSALDPSRTELLAGLPYLGAFAALLLATPVRTRHAEARLRRSDAACALWAIDNNVTQSPTERDAHAVVLGQPIPEPPVLASGLRGGTFARAPARAAGALAPQRQRRAPPPFARLMPSVERPIKRSAVSPHDLDAGIQ